MFDDTNFRNTNRTMCVNIGRQCSYEFKESVPRTPFCCVGGVTLHHFFYQRLDMWTVAEKHSLTTLLNSFFLEWGHYQLEWPYIKLESKGLKLQIELKKYSYLGHHEYTGNIYLNSKRIHFHEFLETLKNILRLHPSFIERVLQSNSCIEETLKHNLPHIMNVDPTFKHTETALYLGHSLHPTPKSRTEFNEQDLLTYSPEHGGQFKLSWLLVHQSIYFEEHSSGFNDTDWAQRMCAFKKKENFKLIPVHPWQKQHILKLDVIKKYLEIGLIIDIGEDESIWTPTSSLRTVYQENSPYMLKFSMNLKMTNSIRHLLVHELKRGIQIFDVSRDPTLTSFFEEFNHFKIIQEPLYAGIKGEDSHPLTQTLIMLRDNPFTGREEVALLATLNQPAIYSEEPLITKLLKKSGLSPLEWFSHFLQNAIAPFILLEAKHGILLGAHQQNVILKLENGKPIGVYFRDCHGTGFDANKVVLYQNIPSLQENNGNILEQPLSHYLFAYYLIINSVFNTIATLASVTNTEEKLLEIYQQFLEGLKTRDSFDSTFVNYLLYSPKLKHKGNFFCTVRNINENTASSPLDIYTDINNPLKVITHG